MADAITIKALQDASLDAKSLEEVVNGNEVKQVTTRKGETYPSVKKAIKTMFANGGLPATPFATKALMTASALVDGKYAVVTDDAVNNGLYVKKAGAWVVSSFLKDSTNIKDVRVVADTAVSGYVMGNYNLLDMDSLTSGVINTDGSENIGFNNYFFTALIPVDVGEVYSLVNGNVGLYANAGLYHIAYYNDSFEFIKRVEVTTSAKPSEVVLDSEVEGRVLFTPPDGVYYIRINLRKNGDMYIYKGSDIKPFVRYGAELSRYTQLSNTQKYNLQRSAKKEVDADYLVTGKNLLDAGSLLHGYSLKLDVSGEIVKNGNYAVSDYVPVMPNQRYTATSKNGWVFISAVFYDSEKKPFSRADLAASGVINTPDNTYFMRLTIKTLLQPVEGNELMVNVGEALPYQPFIKRIKYSLLDNPVAQPANLFEHTKAVDGFSISPDGSIVEHSSYSVSDFIPVEPYTKYAYSFTRETGNAFAYTATYDKNKQFIERLVTVGGEDSNAAVYEFNPDVAYIRLSMNLGRASSYSRMVNKGTTRGNYELGMFKTLEGVKFGEMPTQAIKEIVDDTYLAKPTIDMPMNGVFHNTKDSTFFTQFADWKTRPAADVISLYESLRIQHPQYITKEVLGEDLDGNKMLLYKFTPEKVSHSSHVSKVKRPKVFLTLATHGHEHLGPLSTYLMLERLANDWTQDPLLEALRFNVEFLVIPIVNMYGYDNGSRTNKNGVDPNRNFPEDWYQGVEGTATYGGEFPLSELEAQNISSVFDNHPDIDIMYDYHTMTGKNFNYLWIPTGAGQLMEQVGHNLMTRMSHKYAKDLDFLPKDYIHTVGYVDRDNGGMIHNHAMGRGIRLAATFETSRYWGDESGLVSYDETHCITAYESITNLILLSVDTLVSK